LLRTFAKQFQSTMENETVITAPPVSLTPGAVTEVRRLIESQSIPASQGLRVGVKGGGCSGMSYVLGFDEKQEGDEEYLIEGVRVLMNKSHQLYLYGMAVDFENGLNARGFVFQNPNAKTTCGCGTSFSA
jgi:iron-sulfur cluster assembly protein